MRTAALLLAIGFCAASPFDGRFWQAGETLINRLRSQSPVFEGVPLREYEYRDLNRDNTFELIEIVNDLQESAPGWLNDEIAPAFDQHRIYRYRNGRFEKSYPPFAEYLERRIEFYEHWKRLITHPKQLSEDSQGLIEVNQAKFLRELDRLISLMRQLQQPPAQKAVR